MEMLVLNIIQSHLLLNKLSGVEVAGDANFLKTYSSVVVRGMLVHASGHDNK